MAPPPRKASTTAEVALVSLKSCLVNLPDSLVAALGNANVAPQNVVIELQFKPQTSLAAHGAKGTSSSPQKSAYAGWTGMPSRRRPAPVTGRRGGGGRDQEISKVEVDATFAGLLGLSEGQKTSLFVHLDPPIAHTVNIEPLTPSDWEVIELHANFLELNLLSQVRALPNPNYSAAAPIQAEHLHPLTLHLSPTSTAKVAITSLAPPIPDSSPFAKIAPDAEVIVAPKLRARPSRGRKDDGSVASAGQWSARSADSPSRPRSSAGKNVFLLRGFDRARCQEWFPEDDPEAAAKGLLIWVHTDIIAKVSESRWVTVCVVRPAGLRAQLDQHQMQQLKEQESSEAGLPASKVVAEIRCWEDAPDDQHAALSPTLCLILGFEQMTGCLTLVEPATPPLQRAQFTSIKLYPFLPDSSSKREGFRFGGDTKLSKQATATWATQIYGADNGLLTGPISDGMILPPSAAPSFAGGIIRVERSGEGNQENSARWVLGSKQNIELDPQLEIPKTMPSTTLFPTFDPEIPKKPLELVGIDKTIKECMNNLRRGSSILLTGGIGSGKTSLAHFLCQRLCEEDFFNVKYFSCHKLVTDETRISTIKDTLTRLFMSASWCARLGGSSVVVLDGLDKICPVETELQVGNDNGRSRLITEIFCSITRYYCTPGSGIGLLATAQSKDALNHIIVSGHLVASIIDLKAPDKEARRKMLANLINENTTNKATFHNDHLRHQSGDDSDPGPLNQDQVSWMSPSRPGSSSSTTPTASGFVLSPSLDLLDLAGRTDGFMPGDLTLLVSRARNECLTRTISTNTEPQPSSPPTLTQPDFLITLQTFTPTSLRSVPLTRSTTTFSSVGGLHSTRTTLLETLLYPTKYAPIFVSSPLRLRSGLLLYGYPGCGKTLLASAVAGECGLNFISVKGPEILNKYIGASEKSVRDLFERAQAAKPCVLFFDEFDSVAPKRGHDSTGVTDRVVNQLLTQMDGAEGLEGVYVLAATSRPDLIDPALLRPGRLDKSLLCDMPDRGERVDILRAVSEKLVLGDGVEERLSEVARRTEGFSGADLQALMYNAHLEAVHGILGDAATVGPSNKEGKKMANATSQSSRGEKGARSGKGGKSGNRDEFIQFLFDPDADAAARSSSLGASASPPLLEPPAIVAERVTEMKRAKRREKQLQRHAAHAFFDSDTDTHHDQEGKYGAQAPEKKKKEAANREVVISWANVESALTTTRSSISEHERRRLAAIYREFVVGRNGEMPSGEGGREVGGRSSLM